MLYRCECGAKCGEPHVNVCSYSGSVPQIGQFQGSRLTGGRYWEGGCTCGSGHEGRELYDARGIYCGITCASCKREDKYRRDVMTNPSYDVDEPIDED